MSLFWVCKERINIRHNFGALVANKFPQRMLRVPFPFSKVIQHTRSSVFLGHSIHT
ncbi:hypothetical protein Hanom_Chr09g00823931 [Helianthus anomalus]